MLYVWPYKLGSRSAKALAEQLYCKRIRGEKRIKSYSSVINWGSSGDPEIMEQRTLSILNKPEAVAVAKNKLQTLDRLKVAGVSIPDFSKDKNDVIQWLREESLVYARHMLEAHSGRGIEVLGVEDVIPNAPLYVKGISKTHEYRVHVGGNTIIDFAKKRRRDGGNHNENIRNLDNGWVFCRDNVLLPTEVAYQAINAVKSLGLDFGAVDVLYKEREHKAWVLEVNTAPGLEGTTLERYVSYFKRIL